MTTITMYRITYTDGTSTMRGRHPIDGTGEKL